MKPEDIINRYTLGGFASRYDMKTEHIINRYTLGGHDNNYYRMRFDVCETWKLVNISIVRRLHHEIDPLSAKPFAYCQIKNKAIHMDDAIDFETARKLWSDAIEDGWIKMETLQITVRFT